MDAVARRTLKMFGFAQVVVVWKDESPAADALTAKNGPPVSDYFLKNLPDAVTGLALKDHGKAAPTSRHFPLLGVTVGYIDSEGARALTADDAVKSVHYAAQLSLIRPVGPSVPNAAATEIAANMTWGLQRLGIRALWEEGYTGGGVRVGHLDTGVDGAHPALRNRIAGFAEFDYNGNLVPGSNPHDTGEHGTHTAGTICGGQINSLSIGVAPDVHLFSAIVIEGGNALMRVLAGMEWTLSQGVRVLSMSLGFRGYTPFLLQVTQRLRQRGVAPVFAIGNEGPGTSRSPGNYAEALSVGATDQTDHVADFSSSITFNRPTYPNVPIVVAPGVDIVSAMPGGGIQTMSGTSMATPHVAGVVALLSQAKPSATVKQIEDAITSTCIQLPNESPLREGYGLMDPLAALNAL